MIKTSLDTNKMIDKESLDYLSMYMNITDKMIKKLKTMQEDII